MGKVASRLARVCCLVPLWLFPGCAEKGATDAGPSAVQATSGPSRAAGGPSAAEPGTAAGDVRPRYSAHRSRAAEEARNTTAAHPAGGQAPPESLRRPAQRAAAEAIADLDSAQYHAADPSSPRVAEYRTTGLPEPVLYHTEASLEQVVEHYSSQSSEAFVGSQEGRASITIPVKQGRLLVTAGAQGDRTYVTRVLLPSP